MATSSYSTDDEDDICDALEFFDITEGEDTNEWLLRDVNLFKQLYGDSIVNLIEYHGIDMADVQLSINPGVLQNETCIAWGISPFEKITVELHISLSKYVFGQEPTVKVYQSCKSNKFCLGKQLQNITQDFIAKQWKELSNFYSHRFCISTNTGDQSQDSSSCTDTSNINTLVNMGFPRDKVNKACYICSGNLEDALDLLVNDTNGLIIDEVICQSILKDPKEFNNTTITIKDDTVKSSDRDKIFGGFHENLHLMPVSSSRPAKIKSIPSIKNGFLVQTYQYIMQRLQTLNEFCVMCDEPHIFQNGPMSKPSLCARELCWFAYNEIGVMSDLSFSIMYGAEVVDLHLAMATAACNSRRRDVVFDPFPIIVNPKNSREFILSPKKKDYVQVMKALAAIPPMSELTSLSPDALLSELEKKNSISYLLMQWIIMSNRCHIIKLPNEMQLNFMHTPHQFLLMSSPPAKEQSFFEAKQEYGVTYAFHGSHIENWHSIMRTGLLNASGTKYQLHGAAFGKGIYLSPSASVSFGYSNMGWGKHESHDGKLQCQDLGSRFLRSKNLTCIALCEVVPSSDLVKATPSAWVCSNSDHVSTRFFFVYEDGRVGDLHVNTENEAFRVRVAKAIESYKHMFKSHFGDIPQPT